MSQDPQPLERMLTLAEIARLYSVSRRTLENWISDGQFPTEDHRTPTRQRRWRQSTVTAAIAAGDVAKAEPGAVQAGAA